MKKSTSFSCDWMLVVSGYVFVLFLLAVYSYSQIDLNLTISANPVYQSVQRELLYLGYFNRPLSAYIFAGVLAGLYVLYLYILERVSKDGIPIKVIGYLVAGSVIFGVISYPAFSHDLFNYMFDARIVTQYGKSPYLYAAQDFPSDLWVRFMHWTHRTYPYGPGWLFITVPVSFLGVGKFVPTLLLFKVMFALFHVGNIWLLYRIAQSMKIKNPMLPVVFYALNPLVVIESVISPHNEVAMVFFLLAGIYFLQKKSNRWSMGYLLLSGGIKFVTWVLLPIFLFHKKIQQRWGDTGMLYCMICMLLIPLSYIISQREPYSWYFLPFFPIVALFAHTVPIRIFSIGISFALLLRYAPFLYFGDYTDEMRVWQNAMLWGVLFAAVFSGVWCSVKRRHVHTRAY